MIEASAIILAGGKNTRMKRNKAFLKLGEEPLIEKTVKAFKEYFQETIIVTNEPDDYEYLQVTITGDIIPGQGPLSGMHAGLIKASYTHSLIVACDMPFLEMDLAVYLTEKVGDYDVIVPRLGHYFQPLFAVYSKKCIQPIESCLGQGITKIIAFYPLVKVKYIDQEKLAEMGVTPRVFFNINTPDELQQARSIAGGLGGKNNETN